MRYIFGDYVLDTQRQELHRAGEPLKLRRKVFQVLVYLLMHRERVVPKQELLAHLWPDQFVGDETVKSCLKTLRQALGERGRTPHFVRTLHGQGYRFVAAVEECLEVPRDRPTGPAAFPYLTEVSSPPLPAVAVSPDASALPVSASPSPPSAALPPALQHLPTGERRQVTVLCGTLAHTTALTDRLGLEGFRYLVQTFHTLTQECVQRYEGTVQTLGEESMLALFGVPVAQEEHAWRAARAGLELQQWLQSAPARHETLPTEALTARVGVHTGWVVAGSHRDEAQQFVVVGGDTTQGAMRLQALADPGTLLVSDTTLRLLHGTVCSTAYGLVHVPGHATPIMAYTVQSLEAPTAAQLWSPFVGRQRELAVLNDLLVRILGGQGQVVGLIGEPGIGKSRLLAECQQRLPERPVTVLEGHCRAYERLLPYGPVRDLLRHQCGLSTTSSLEVVATRVAQLLRAVDLPPEDSAPYLLQILGSPTTAEPLAQLTPDVIKERTFATLRQVHLRSSQQQPLLLIVENLHWIDPTSEAYLASLVEQLAGMPLLLLTTYRPGYRPRWIDKSYATQFTLPPLTQEEGATVVRAVLPPEHSAEPLVQRVLARAAGNPLFLEELAQAVREQGDLGADTPVPETIQAVLAARIDHLPPEAKHLLHTAAVLGTEVPLLLLEAIAELPEAVLHRSLARLQAAEFLYETRLVPERVYTFKHALTHEVAYGSLLQERRRLLHARVVEVLEALAPARGAEGASRAQGLPTGSQGLDQVERLAHHALRGEVWDKAVTYCQQAGARAHDRAAFREAVATFEQALQALDHLPEDGDTREQALELHLALGAALIILGEYERHLALLGEAEALARALNDRARLGRVLAQRGQTHRITGDLDGAIAAGQQALALAAALGETPLQVEASHRLGQIYASIGDFGRAAELLRWSVEAADRESGAPRTELRIQSQASLALTLGVLGEFAEGRRYGEEALRLAMLAGRGGTPIFAHSNLGDLYLAQGDLEHAIRVLEQGLARCRASGDRNWVRGIMAKLGYASALQGRLAEGRTLLEEAISESRRTDAVQGLAHRVAWLSEVCRLAGRHEEAWQHACQALDLARQRKQRGNEARALYQLGAAQAHADPPDVAQAQTYYQQALALADALGMRPLQAHCHRDLGTLYATIGQREQAHAALATAIELYRAMAMTFWLPQAEAALAQVA
jgi:DNA-binding winged helix-turn-helix (wHTH) protein/class 3 adenylate cyclase/tetratricopeptide (TPR) repeat protein